MKNKASILAVLLVFIFLAPLNGAQNKIVAVVNNDVVLDSDVKNLVAFMNMQLLGAFSGKDLEKQMEEVKKSAVTRLIEDRLIMQQASKQKIEVESERLKIMMDRTKDKFPSNKDFLHALKSQGLTIADLEKRFREQLMMQGIMDKEVRQKVKVAPYEITAYYMGHPDEFKEPESLYLDSILLEDQDKLSQAQQQFDNGVEFKLVAERLSNAPSLGLVKRGQLQPDIENTVFGLEIGKVSLPVKTDAGFYLFCVREKMPGRTKELYEVEDQIHEMLSFAKMDKLFAGWVAKLKKDAYIEMR